MTENEALKELNVCIGNRIYLGCGAEAMHTAINALNEIQKYRSIGTIEECQDSMERQKAIEEQPKISEWILCSERLPDHEGQVLVQVSGKYRNTVFNNAFELAEYDKNEGWILEIFPKWESPDVIAWQPLPKPYKTGE